MTKKNNDSQLQERYNNLEYEYNKLFEEYTELEDKYTELEDKHDEVLKENEELKVKLTELNENTIISSMNDMKQKYEELMANSVCLSKYETIKRYYKTNYELVRTCANIQIILKNNIYSLKNVVRRDLNRIKEYEKKLGEVISEELEHNKEYGSLALINKLNTKITLLGELASLNELDIYTENNSYYDDEYIE